MKLFLMCSVFLLLGMGASRALAQSPAIQDLAFNSNGTYIDAASDLTFVSDASALGVNLSSYSTYATGNGLGTGLGTITYTTTASGFFDTGIWEAVGDATFYDEYAATGGSLASGESYEVANLDAAVLPNVFTDVAGNALSDTNNVPGETSVLNGPCSGANCDASVGAELGYAFSVAAGDEEIITITASETAPGSGFYIEQSDPDAADYPAGTSLPSVFFSLSAQEIPVGTPPATPEPSTWLLMLTGLAAGATRLRSRSQFKAGSKLLGGLAVVIAGLVMAPFANAQAVETVPWAPTNPAAPHTTFPEPIGGPYTSEAAIVLGAVFVGGSSTDSYTYSWNFGDGASTAAAPITNPNDISAIHQYPFSAATGTNWTATVTVVDTTISTRYTGNYLVIQEANNLQSRANVAIDYGLWYLHQSMYHPAAGQGNWSQSCASGYSGYACSGYGSIDATNVQAFEVNGHLGTGPATDPYTSDIQEALNHMFTNLTAVPIASQITYEGVTGGSKSYTYNPATANFGCSDGTAPTTTNSGSPHFYCDSSATPVYYNASATSCTTPPCKFTFDGNSNGQAIYAFQESGYPYGWGYEAGMYMDSLVASTTPNTAAPAGSPAGIAGETYQNIVQDLADADEFCQWPGDQDVSSGYTRGYPYGGNFGQGGGWWYDCQEGNDNSVSQWASIGLIGAERGFGISIPSIVSDANNTWVTDSQDVQTTDLPISGNPQDSSSDAYGAFGYNGSLYYSEPWGPFATTPSGMVQMALDGIGRTANTAFGSASNAPDQRFNNVETYYADNFCNSVTGSYSSGYYTPRNYAYGLFSFTKSMLLHNPGGSLSPIQYLRTQTPGVFPNSNPAPGQPANTIDWYAALSPANGGTDACDGVAQTIIERQYLPAGTAAPGYNYNGSSSGYNSVSPGYWYADTYDGGQYPYETAWNIIMLQRTVFVNCVNNLQGVGAPGLGIVTKARVGLSWTGIPNVTGYNIQRSSINGGPYTTVGSTTGTVYSDTSGLVNGDTYYYVLQPVNAEGAVCQSNQATVKIP
jgi:hypothetical protein